jgi:EAL domain-containing protein (putative c-di-GMP-specific phosphodiesterase class I)
LLRDYQRPSWQLTLRTLKIDRSLVDRSRRRRLLAFLELAAGREVVIEGVESEDDFAYLLGLAPNALFQGYHFSRPLPPAAFEEYLKAENEAVLVTI